MNRYIAYWYLTTEWVRANKMRANAWNSRMANLLSRKIKHPLSIDCRLDIDIFNLQLRRVVVCCVFFLVFLFFSPLLRFPSAKHISRWWFQMSFAFFCCHLRYAGFGHINQKLSPYCSRGSSRKQYSHFIMWKLRGSAFCRNLSLCLLHFLWTTYKDIVYRHILRFIRCNCFTWAVVNTSWQGS